MGDIEEIFRATLPKTAADKIINETEQFFKNPSENIKEMTCEQEKKLLNMKIKNLKKKLNSIKNPKNLRVASRNNKTTEIRAKIRNEIATCQDRLLELDIEQQGTERCQIPEKSNDWMNMND